MKEELKKEVLQKIEILNRVDKIRSEVGDIVKEEMI